MSFLGLFAILALFAQVLHSGSGVIEGVVTEAGTGQTIPGTRITLFRNAPARETTTDERGHFAFAGLSQGGYSVSAQRDGYLGAVAGGTFQMSVSTPVVMNVISSRKPLCLRSIGRI